LLYHSYSQKGFVAMGRQMLLDEVVFNADGWPSINRGRGPSLKASAPKALVAQQENRSIDDQFESEAALKPRWQWPIGREAIMRINNGWLTVVAGAQPTLLTQSIRSLSFMAETSIQLTGETSAGLGIFGSESNYVTLVADGARVRLVLHQRSEEKELASTVLPEEGDLKLRIASVDGSRFRFAFSHGAGPWTEISSEGDGDFLPPWDRAVRIGYYVAGRTGGEARFDYFKLKADGESLLSD
jgi:beta-xylosidase